VREDLADIIDFAIEELVRQRYELPSFPTLLKAAQKARTTVNRGLYTRIAQALDEAAKARIDHLFTRTEEGRRSAWICSKVNRARGQRRRSSGLSRT
jgi:hypothetical protein